MKDQRVLSGIFILIFVLVFRLTILKAETPEELVKKTYDNAIGILKDIQQKGPEKKKELKNKLWEEISNIVDFPEASRRALGQHWKKFTSDEKKEFVDLFSSIIYDSYINKVEVYSDEKVVFLGEKLDGNYATVQTKIITKTETEIDVDYHLLNKQGGWKAYDIIIEGVSLVNNYRTQFNSILVKSSPEELMGKMRQKKVSVVKEEEMKK